MGVQVVGQRAGRDGLAQARDQVLSGAWAGEVEAGQYLQPHRLTVGAVAEVLDLLHVGDLGHRAASRPMAAMSAGLTVPLLRAMTTRTGVWFGSWNGAASRHGFGGGRGRRETRCEWPASDV